MKNTFSQIFNRWIRYDRRIVLPKAVYENIVLLLRNINFPFSDHLMFSRKFPRNFSKISRKFPGKFLTPHLPHVPTPHITHSHPTPKTLNPPRTSNPIFSNTHFLLDYVFFSHRIHIYTYSFNDTDCTHDKNTFTTRVFVHLFEWFEDD